jgi:hypothetical protein
MKLDANEVEFKAVVGDEYKNQQMKLLVIGRATNGWENSGKNAFEELLKNKDYNIRRSAFWRMSFKVLLQKNDLEEDDISNNIQKLAWSNLYKFAPISGGNPSNKSMENQYEDCVHELKSEFKSLKPHVAILFTGENWFNDFKDIFSDCKEVVKNNVVLTCKFNDTNTKVIVCNHPQGKKESELLSEILKHL